MSAETALKSAQDEMQKAQAALDSYTPPVITEPENLPDYDRRRMPSRCSSRIRKSGSTD